MINFDGNKGKYPSAFRSISPWFKLNGCEDEMPQDFSSVLDGKTNITSIGLKNCEQDKSGLLWTVHGGGHIFPMSEKVSIKVLDHLLVN